ncbi:nuclear transport factor 2 family protein [Myxococcota bacterium]|nr:nuclear transport factor 2 family protein [Myxococcota bacterium]
MSGSLAERVEALESRLERAEAELEIHRLIVRYGLAVDAGDAEAAMALFTEDAVYEVRAVDTGLRESSGQTLWMEGAEAVGHMVLGENHQSLLPNSAHTIGPVVVSVEGDRGRATGYSRIYHREEDDFRLFRIGMNHWELVKRPEGWRIARRVSQAVGAEDVMELTRLGLE